MKSVLLVAFVLFFCRPVLLLALELPADPHAAGRFVFVGQDALDKGFKDQIANVKMTLINKAGQQSVRKFKLFLMETDDDGDKSVILFDFPVDIRGTALLTHEHIYNEDDQWLYLPSLKRFKRVASRNKTGSFVGSELSYEDIASQKPEKYGYNYIGQGQVEKILCYVIERFPKDRYSGYAKQLTWVAQDNLQTVQIDYYDRKKELLKRARFTEYREYGHNIWRCHRISVNNIQTGKSTLLEIDKYRLDQGLTSKTFSTRFLEEIR